MNENDVKEIIRSETGPVSGIGCAILLLYLAVAVGAFFFGGEIKAIKLRLKDVEVQRK